LTTRSGCIVVLCGLVALAAPAWSQVAHVATGATAAGADAPAGLSDTAGEDELPPLQGLFDPLAEQSPRPMPDWIRRTTSAVFERFASVTDDWHVAVQQERDDGTDLLTLRHPLADLGPVQTYVGAGINRTDYFARTSFGPTVLNGRARHRTLGAAAELGAELRLSDELRLRADLRWIDLSQDAMLLRSGDSLVAADPLALGLSVGWRFP
jgi:hypothetical protein